MEDREVKQAWRGWYGTKIADDLHSSDALLARTCREMRRFTATLVPLGPWRRCFTLIFPERPQGVDCGQPRRPVRARSRAGLDWRGRHPVDLG